MTQKLTEEEIEKILSYKVEWEAKRISTQEIADVVKRGKDVVRSILKGVPNYKPREKAEAGMFCVENYYAKETSTL